ncbi:DUF6807 family protein [Niabella ginsengisoli]|uniref:PmoA family protein n=1 Tax=Niabella ginsengisoli TaxID=522298 RepID=A0ABS9SIB1_9BACT|nr:DUF6807 family protein [Niabella ginsengisoli]MCH5598075.1 PmoA family protein [Niabella ginsengisoli]
MKQYNYWPNFSITIYQYCVALFNCCAKPGYRFAGIVLFLFITITAQAQRIATIQATTTGKEKFNIPMQVNLDALTHVTDSSLQLLEIKNGKEVAIPFQIEGKGNTRNLYWLITPSTKTNRIFELVKATSTSSSQSMQVEENNGAFSIVDNAKQLLQYHSETVYPPKGIDTAYKRSGFIHPLNTPSGHALTRINAKDHYHHWGMWNPWTHVLFEKDTVDFWNLRDRKGTVRFEGFSSIENGNVYAGFSALHEHVAFKKMVLRKPRSMKFKP